MRAQDISDESIRELGAAICIQAVLDYRKSLQGAYGAVIGKENGKNVYKPVEGGRIWLLKNKNGWHPASLDGIDAPEVYEDFFKSDWFKQLSGEENERRVILFLKSARGRHVQIKW